ncbi:PREDICTED: tropomyosin-like [Nicotiana attenuata]|uniref:tropomyosin-like n=1 Tax=Nicotiana attenuata TaxID=49451 RepID=UPI000905C23B|nr:PREDICTED: tropomyosin-like [Nicotiana attenuata]
MIGQLRGVVNQVRVDCHQWKENMDRLTTKKEAVKAQLTSAEAQIRGAEAKGLDLAREIEELEAELTKARTEAAYAKAEVAQAKTKAKKMKLRAASNRAKRSGELAKCQAGRETLEEVRARGFDLAEEIAEAQARETDARFLVSSDDEDVVSGYGDGESEEDAPEGEEASEDKAI